MVYWHKVKNIYLQRYLKRNQHWLLFFILSPPTLFYSSSIQWIDHHCGFPPPHGCLIRQVLDAHCCSHGQGQETRLALPLFSCSVRNQNKMQFNYAAREQLNKSDKAGSSSLERRQKSLQVGIIINFITEIYTLNWNHSKRKTLY